VGIGLGYTLYLNVGGGDKYFYNEFTIDYGHDFTEELGATVYASAAYLAEDAPGAESGLFDGTIGADISYALSEVWSVGASLTYIAQLDDKVLTDVVQVGDTIIANGYDVDVVGMLSFGASF
jgi:hypothetical protein